MSQDNPDLTVNVLTKEELLKITEDPYFQYLVEKKARSQTKAYLALVGSAILAILAYGGWTFKSATDQIDLEKTAIQTTREKIQHIADDVKKQNDETSKEATSVKDTVANAKSFAEQGKLMTDAMLETARANVENSQKSQGTFLLQQDRVLNTVSQINQAAGDQLAVVRNQLKEVTTLADKTNDQVAAAERGVKDVLASAVSLDQVRGNLDKLTDSANRLNLIQDRLLQGGIVGTVFMRSKQPSTIRMLDPDHPDLRENDWLITFTRFKLSNTKLSVWGEARRNSDSELIPFEVLDMDSMPSKLERQFHTLKKYGIPFKVQLNFAYHSLASRDFASLRVLGEDRVKTPLLVAGEPTKINVP